MPLQILAGPAGSGKSQIIEQERGPFDVVIDYTGLFVAVAGVQRDAAGRYPERSADDPRIPFVQALKTSAAVFAAERQLSGFVTTADPREIQRLAGITGGDVRIVDPGRAVVTERLRDPATGALSQECSAAVSKWYENLRR